MLAARRGNTAIVLVDGTVLVTGSNWENPEPGWGGTTLAVLVRMRDDGGAMPLSDLRPTDPKGVTAFLRERFGAGVNDVLALAGGEWSRAFAFGEGGRDWVIRIADFDLAFRKDELATRWSSDALPIPRVLEVGSVGDGFFAISERMTGAMLETIDEPQLRAVLPSLLGTLDALRLADVSAFSGYGGWDASGNGWYPSWQAMLLDVATDDPARPNHGWRDRLAHSEVGDRPFAEAYDVLTSLVEKVHEERHLIHADFMNRNVMVSENKISGVFDWGCGMYGDFLMDLAWIDFWAPWSPGWDAVDIIAAARDHFRAIGLNVPNVSERIRACQIYVGLDGMAFQAHIGRWADLARTAARTLEVAGRP